jgi:hypothetical protein
MAVCMAATVLGREYDAAKYLLTEPATLQVFFLATNGRAVSATVPLFLKNSQAFPNVPPLHPLFAVLQLMDT